MQLKYDKELEDLSFMFDAVLKGWNNYYGRFYPSEMSVIWNHMNDYLVRWMRRKYKHLARHKTKARQKLAKLENSNTKSFIHWKLGYVSKAG